MYRNFRILNNTSRSIAMTIVEAIVAVVLFILAFAIGGEFIATFMILGIALVCFSLSSLFTFLKCTKFGHDSAFKDDLTQASEKDKAKFKTFNTLIAIFMVIAVLLFVIGCIILLIQIF